MAKRAKKYRCPFCPRMVTEADAQEHVESLHREHTGETIVLREPEKKKSIRKVKDIPGQTFIPGCEPGAARAREDL